MADDMPIINAISSTTLSAGKQALVSKAMEDIKKYARYVGYSHSSEIASIVLSILIKNSINKETLPALSRELDSILLPESFWDSFSKNESPKKKLSDWFFRLCHPSNTGGGKHLRKWLIENGVTLSFIKIHFDFETKDYLDFTAGFILGLCKSFTYDNVKGIYDLLGLGVNLQLMINDYQKELLTNLVNQYQQDSKTSIQLAVKSAMKLQEAIKETLLNSKNDHELKQITAIAVFFSEIRTIVLGYCINPFMKFLDDEAFKLFDQAYRTIVPFMDKESEEYEKAGSAWSYAYGKYVKELEKKVSPLLLEYRIFEAGAVTGNIVGDITQILEGLITFLLSAGKITVKGGKLISLKLLKLSAADKVKVLALITAMSAMDIKYLKNLPVLSLDAPGITLFLEKSDINKVSDAIKKQLSVFESKQFKIVDAEVTASLAKEVKPASRTPLLFESSITGGEPYLLHLLGVLVVLKMNKRRRKGTSIDDNELNDLKIDEAIIEAQNKLFTQEFKVKLTNGLKKFSDVFPPDEFLKKMGKAEGINFPEGATPEKILELLHQKWMPEFETYILEQLKKGTAIKKKGIYTRYNSFINKRIRLIAAEFNNHGLIVLVDEPMFKLFDTLNSEALALTRTRGIKVGDLLNMSIKDFYQQFYPNLKKMEGYDKALKNVQNVDSKIKKLFTQRDSLLSKIEKEIKLDKNSKKIGEWTDEYDSLNDEIYDRIDELIEKGKISSADGDELLYSAFGKLNPFGKCGSARPDIGIMNLYYGNFIYDFIHVSRKGAVNSKHLIGTDFYQDFFRVLFGEIPLDSKITKDIPYTIPGPLRKKLKD